MVRIKKKKFFTLIILMEKIKRPNKNHLNECLKFLKKINHKTTHKNFQFQKASDACLSVQDHINACEKRINKLRNKYNFKKNNESKKIYKFLKINYS